MYVDGDEISNNYAGKLNEIKYHLDLYGTLIMKDPRIISQNGYLAVELQSVSRFKNGSC